MTTPTNCTSAEKRDADIKRTWESDPAIRAEFGTVECFTAYARHAKDIAFTPLPAPVVVAPVTPTPAPAARIAPVVVAPVHAPARAMSIKESADWLSKQYTIHQAQARVNGMTFAHACAEARRLSAIDQKSLRIAAAE